MMIFNRTRFLVVALSSACLIVPACRESDPSGANVRQNCRTSALEELPSWWEPYRMHVEGVFGTLQLRHAHAIDVLTFSPDDKMILSAGQRVCLWDAVTGREVRSFGDGQSRVRTARFSSDGSLVFALMVRRGTIKVSAWAVDSGNEKWTYSFPWKSFLHTAALSPDGMHAVLPTESSFRNSCCVIEVASGKTEYEVYVGESVITSVAISADGEYCVAASDNVKVWRLASGDVVLTVPHRRNPTAIASDGTRVALNDFPVDVWDVHSKKHVYSVSGHAMNVDGVAFSGDGEVLVTCCGLNQIRTWEAGTGVPKAAFKAHDDRITAIAANSDGSCVASASEDHTVRLWHAETGEEVRTSRGHGLPVISVGYLEDQHILLSPHVA